MIRPYGKDEDIDEGSFEREDVIQAKSSIALT
jgi:hypothetical protein